MMLLAAHPSRHRVLCDCIDPAIGDEQDPLRHRDPELDLFAPGGPQPPYGAAFVERYRAAQVARVRRITADVKRRLTALGEAGRPDEERAFVVHGTMADLRAFDPQVDPNDRTPGTSFIGDPRLANNGPTGLARFTTLRSWLSQWSVDDAHADGIRAGADITVPVLVVDGTADNICTPAYANELYAGLASDDKQRLSIEGATHYYLGPDQRAHLQTAIGHCTTWLAERELAAVAADRT
jgi:pimeloyl-ACP methyl ester carboxylesterase